MMMATLPLQKPKMNKQKKLWWFNGVVGALLLGSGLSIALECSQLKHNDGDFWLWTLGGTAGIGMVLSGVVLLSRAGIINQELKNQSKNKSYEALGSDKPCGLVRFR